MKSYKLIADHPDFLVVSKSAGAPFHTEGNKPGIIEQLRQGLSNPDLLPVHRLDTATSGLLLVAKHKSACHDLCELFAQRQVQKYYLAISDKKPKKKQGAIIGDMEKARRGNWKLLTTKTNPAVTQFFSYSLAEGRRLFILKPHTGKSHQLRVALKSLGSPIVGDERYGHKGEDGRMLLHACELGFDYRGESFCFRNLPQDSGFSRAIESLPGLDFNQLPWPVLPASFSTGKT